MSARRYVEALKIMSGRLRSTRANMLGTDDEPHYWDCHNAADMIDELAAALEKGQEAWRRDGSMYLEDGAWTPRGRYKADWRRVYVIPWASPGAPGEGEVSEPAHGPSYAELERQLAEARRDAERYRWLRDVMPRPAVGQEPFWLRHGDDLDEAIDAAREGEEPAPGTLGSLGSPGDVIA